tara:strand:+ start:3222 stop:3614 length:393 start_codon:yes stop_codon:yes gene_type:complete
MNYKKIEKSLLHPTIEVLTELQLYKKSKTNVLNGYVYTLYNDSDKKILIGYTSNITNLTRLYYGIGYKLKEKRKGTNRELKLLKETLLELGFKENNDYSFDYSINLLKYLNILGWPSGNLNQSKRLKKSS